MHHHLTITDKILAKTVLRLIPFWISPNLVTWLRFWSVPFLGYFLWNGNYAIAFPLFFVSAFSDAVDGSLARTRDKVTNFGKMFDPLADKFLIATSAIILMPKFIGWGIMLTIVSIELVLVASAYAQKRFYGKIIQAENTGKIKMIFQSLGIGAVLVFALWGNLFFLDLAQYFFYIAIFFALLSLAVYRAI